VERSGCNAHATTSPGRVANLETDPWPGSGIHATFPAFAIRNFTSHVGGKGLWSEAYRKPRRPFGDHVADRAGGRGDVVEVAAAAATADGASPGANNCLDAELGEGSVVGRGEGFRGRPAVDNSDDPLESKKLLAHERARHGVEREAGPWREEPERLIPVFARSLLAAAIGGLRSAGPSSPNISSREGFGALHGRSKAPFP